MNTYVVIITQMCYNCLGDSPQYIIKKGNLSMKKPVKIISAFLALLFCLASLAACAGEPSAQELLIGTWIIDLEHLPNGFEASEGDSFANARWTFNKDGTGCMVDADQESREVTWALENDTLHFYIDNNRPLIDVTIDQLGKSSFRFTWEGISAWMKKV